MKIFKNIVQGDSYRAKVIIKNADGTTIPTSSIAHIYFTSKTLGVQKEILYDSELQSYLLELRPIETELFIPASHSFDLTIMFDTYSIKTATYEGEILVLAKHNEVEY